MKRGKLVILLVLSTVFLSLLSSTAFVSAAVDDYTNIALTNQSNLFYGNQDFQNNVNSRGLLNASNFQTGSNGNVFIGERTAWYNTGAEVVAIGIQAAENNIGSHLISMGNQAGYNNIGNSVVAIGTQAGTNNKGEGLTAIGSIAGNSNEGNNVLAVGYAAGASAKGNDSFYLGPFAGASNIGNFVTALGRNAATSNSGGSLLSLGLYSGTSNTGENVIAIGDEAGYSNSGNNSIAIGYNAGNSNTLNNQFIVQQRNVNSIPLIQGDFGTGNVKIGGGLNATGDVCTGNGVCLNSINSGGNASFNQALTDTLYAAIGSGGMDYTNLAMTNKSNDFGIFNITAGTFFGNLDWSLLTSIPAYVIDYMPYMDSLNASIQNKLDAIDQRYNDTALIQNVNTTTNARIDAIKSFSLYNFTTVDLSTATNTVYNTSVLTLTLPASGNVMIECNLYNNASAAATAIQYTINLTGSSAQTYNQIYYSSATATGVCGSLNPSFQCNGTASAGPVITLSEINMYSARSAAGTFTIGLRSEVAGSRVKVFKGSWCRAIIV